MVVCFNCSKLATFNQQHQCVNCPRFCKFKEYKWCEYCSTVKKICQICGNSTENTNKKQIEVVHPFFPTQGGCSGCFGGKH